MLKYLDNLREYFMIEDKPPGSGAVSFLVSMIRYYLKTVDGDILSKVINQVIAEGNDTKHITYAERQRLHKKIRKILTEVFGELNGNE